MVVQHVCVGGRGGMCSFHDSFTSLVDSCIHKEGSSCGSLKRWAVAGGGSIGQICTLQQQGKQIFKSEHPCAEK